MFDKKLQLPLNENDSLQIPTSQLTLLVETKKNYSNLSIFIDKENYEHGKNILYKSAINST